MPALPAVPSVIRVALVGHWTSGAVVVTRFFIRYTGTAPTNAQLNTFCGSVASAWATNLKALCNIDFTLDRVDAVDLSSPTGAIGTAASAVAGTKAGSILPGDVCAVVSYTIARRYRGGHPRSYWPFGVQADLQDPSHWLPGSISTWTTNVNSFFAAVILAGWTGAGTLDHVAVSYFQGFTVVVNPLTGRARNVPNERTTPLIDAVGSRAARALVGSQRGRLT